MSSIQDRMDLIEESVRRLKDAKIDEEDFFTYQGIKHTLQEAMEACIDIASHIISEKGFDRGDSYSEYFKELGENNVISEDLSYELQQMTKLRNLIIHRYSEIDSDKLEEILQDNLDDLISFVEQISSYIEEEDI